jgi:hypothetical protein
VFIVSYENEDNKQDHPLKMDKFKVNIANGDSS